MAFQIPEGLHPDLNPLAWMVGTWRGKGHGDYPGSASFQFAQEVTFSHADATAPRDPGLSGSATRIFTIAIVLSLSEKLPDLDSNQEPAG